MFITALFVIVKTEYNLESNNSQIHYAIYIQNFTKVLRTPF